MRITQLESYKCGAEIADACVLDAEIDDIAGRFGFNLKSWQVDGLGRHRGMILQFEDDFVACFKETLEKPQTGVHVELDGAILRSLGVEKVVATILLGLELAPERVKWKSPLAFVS